MKQFLWQRLKDSISFLPQFKKYGFFASKKTLFFNFRKKNLFLQPKINFVTKEYLFCTESNFSMSVGLREPPEHPSTRGRRTATHCHSSREPPKPSSATAQLPTCPYYTCIEYNELHDDTQLPAPPASPSLHLFENSFCTCRERKKNKFFHHLKIPLRNCHPSRGRG